MNDDNGRQLTTVNGDSGDINCRQWTDDNGHPNDFFRRLSGNDNGHSNDYLQTLATLWTPSEHFLSSENSEFQLDSTQQFQFSNSCDNSFNSVMRQFQ